jgi:putative alpha-1,2-mannosidase
MTSINVTRNLIGAQYESGALISYKGTPAEIVLRVGISFVSVEQACQNAEEEVGDASFEDIVQRSKDLWNEKLSRVELDVVNTPANVTEMFYTSKF